MPRSQAEQLEFFENNIRPIFAEHCYSAATVEKAEKLKGGLRLDTPEALLKGGATPGPQSWLATGCKSADQGSTL